MKKLDPLILWPCAALFALFIAAVLFRPLMPIDETRYMTVAWEMRLHDGWLSPLTMNFDPYHHKPPLLFWLINLFWSVFGISRWAGLIPLVLSSLATVFLTVQLGRKLLRADDFKPLHITLLFLGCIPFVIYSTLVLFDLTLTTFVLCSLLALLTYTEKRQFRYMLLLGLLMGLGVLTKGPVAYLYILFPVLLAPLWMPGFKRPLAWYGDAIAAIFISIIPICLWLIPVLAQSDNHFAFWLVWEQTAGRITGNFSDAHIRPFYFYLPLLPIMFAPWIFFPAFWRNIKTVDKNTMTARFLICWMIPVFLSFSFISGKQPHYLVPLLPGVIVFLSLCLKDVSLPALKKTVLAVISLAVIGQGIASITLFQNYDLRPIASYVQAHPNHDWAFSRNYHGEIGFLAHLNKPVDDIQPYEVVIWFRKHPNGRAIIRYKSEDEISHLHKMISVPYREKYIGVFSYE